jgi:pSer/pThr/pTyr-binding forkhead associated (FHA) protein
MMSENPFMKDDQSTDAFSTQDVSEDFDISDLAIDHELQTRPARPPMGKQTISIYVSSEPNPLVYEEVDKLVLGRGEDDADPDVDLSLHYGSMLGVSRYHAEISYERGVYYLKDLDSSNGTWLNMRKVEANERLPMESSNQVRLGHLLMLISIG